MATIDHCLYCFESLSANLEKRTPLTLSQVSSSWAEYSKLEDAESSEPEDESSSKPQPRNPILDRLHGSGSSTPASSSSTSSLAPSTAATTPSSSETSFVPVGRRKGGGSSSDLSESPLFVTWNTVSSSGGRSLRGCIGTFEVFSLSLPVHLSLHFPFQSKF